MVEYRSMMCWTHGLCFADGEVVGAVVPVAWKLTLANFTVAGPVSAVQTHIAAHKPCLLTPVWWET